MRERKRKQQTEEHYGNTWHFSETFLLRFPVAFRGNFFSRFKFPLRQTALRACEFELWKNVFLVSLSISNISKADFSNLSFGGFFWRIFWNQPWTNDSGKGIFGFFDNIFSGTKVFTIFHICFFLLTGFSLLCHRNNGVYGFPKKQELNLFW